MSFEFFASFVWAPPVATQFSVLYIIYYIHTHTQTYIYTYIHTFIHTPSRGAN